jgi:NAD(P)H dehydrogenase (quinone)
MGKLLVLYHSGTGNTKAMAELVVEGGREIEGMDVRLRSIEEASSDDLFWCDGLALGSPTNLGAVSWEMKRWWDTEAVRAWLKVDGKMGCAFSSAGGWAGGSEIACLGLLTILMNFGFLVFGVTDYVGKQATCHYGALCAGEPRSDNDQAACRRLGRRLAEWIGYYCEGRKYLHPNEASYPRKPEDFL